jgi:ABC-2 type transport system ATP-binding protein
MALIVNGLSKKYEAQLAVDNLSFTIEKGSVVGFLGPNGAGKSTTLKMIAGFLAPDAGEVILNGISNQKDPIVFKKLIELDEQLKSEGVALAPISHALLKKKE